MNFESLRNKFEKLREEWAEDSHVDFQFKNKQYSADLAQVALDIPFCHNKYLNHYTDISKIKTSLEFEIRKLIRDKREYYGGEADAKVYAEKPFGNRISGFCLVMRTDALAVYTKTEGVRAGSNRPPSD